MNGLTHDQPKPGQTQEQRLARLLDRTEIFDLVRVERYYRDTKDWPNLIGSYIPNSPVRTTWFNGTIEEFAEASRKKMTTGVRPSSAKHWIFPTVLKINGDRALVESPAAIFDRLTFDNVEFDFFQYSRFFSRVVRTPEGWRLALFDAIYQRDHLRCVNPNDKLPVDWEVVKTFRPSYRYLGYCQLRQGYKVSDELLGDDRPDLLEKFYTRELAWLETGK